MHFFKNNWPVSEISLIVLSGARFPLYVESNSHVFVLKEKE